MNRAWHIAGTTLRVQMRDPSSLLIMLVMPIVLIFILGSALGGLGDSSSAFSDLPIAVVNLDEGDIGATISDAFTQTGELKKLFTVTTYSDEAKARTAVERGDLVGALVVPKDLTEKVSAGESVELTVLGDPGRPTSSSVLAAVAESFATRVSAASVTFQTTVQGLTDARLPLTKEQIAGFAEAAAQAGASDTAVNGVRVVADDAQKNREVNALDYYAISMSAMFLLFGAMFGAFSIVRERQDQTLSRLLMTSTPRHSILAGKMLAMAIVGIVQFAALYAFTRSLGVNWGDPVGVWLIGGATVFAVTGLGVVFATLGTTVRAVSGIAPFVVQVMALVGGSFFPVQSLPVWIRPIHYVAINGWAIDGMLELMRGGSVAGVLLNVGVLAAMGVVFLAYGTMRLRWE